MVHFPRYESYKDSGVEWLGKIPSHWDIQKIKYCSLINKDTLSEDTDSDYTFDYVDISSVTQGTINKTEHFCFKDAPSRARRIAKNGDTIISTVRTYLKAIAYINNEQESYIYSTGFCVISPLKKNTNKKYFSYFLQSETFINQIVAYSKGVSFPAITPTELATFPILQPSPEEQQKIANFLDQKVAEIDKAIAKKQKLIELLQEQKAILINRAVTKGLNPNVTMRDSGIEWIGEIPEHWEVTKLKHLVSRMDYGLSESAKSEGEYKYLNMGHVQDGQVLVENTGYLNNAPNSLILENNDILFNRTNSFELVGKSGIYNGTLADKVTFASYLVRLRTNDKTNAIWLNSILNDNCFLGFIRSLALRSLNQANLNPTRLSQVFVPVPPSKEQSQIADTILKINSSFENKINHADKSINLYLELKQILISNAVTGKIKI